MGKLERETISNEEEKPWIDALKVTNPEIHPKGEGKLSIEDIQKLTVVRDEITKKRGRVLSSALLIEELLEVIITDTFFNKDIGKITKEKELFEGAMLEREFFTFMSKWKVFKELCNNHPALNAQNRPDLLTKIKEIINIRNRFAHGKVIFREGKNPTLVYYENGKKEKLLDDSYFEELRVKFNSLHTEMWEILGLEIRQYAKNLLKK